MMSPAKDMELPRCMTERGLTLTLRGALFLNGRAEINADNSLFERLLTVLRGYPDSKVSVEAHTDSLGSEGYNYNLSQRRADSVKLFLGTRGVELLRITALGRGGSRPLASDHTAAGRQQNSRIEVIVHTGTATA
jgi:outer membrane protein OmpA-like peptidoglycan-associated protein